jgi:2-aminoadipate transaminase
MTDAIKKYLPPEIESTSPQGGMFLWLTLPEKIDAMELFHQALQQKVAFVPGETFYTDGNGKNTLRLNFSNVAAERIEEGIRRLGKTIEKFHSTQ